MINDHNDDDADIDDGNNIDDDDQNDEKNLGGETGLGKVDAKEGWERTRVDIDLGIANCLVDDIFVMIIANDIIGQGQPCM